MESESGSGLEKASTTKGTKVHEGKRFCLPVLNLRNYSWERGFHETEEASP